MTTAQRPNAELFVSYASHDRDRVTKIVGRLAKAGVTAWMDCERIAGATRWPAEVAKAIVECKIVLLICSEASLRSWVVKQEIQFAAEKRKLLLPLLMDGSTRPAEVEFLLAGVQYIEILDYSPTVWTPKLLGALQRAGVSCGESAAAGREEASPVEPGRLEWSFEGLRALARFTDQLWAFPAEEPVPETGNSQKRGLGEPQPGVQHSFRIGSRVRVGIEAEQDGHLLLLDEGPEGKIFCLCPSHFAKDTRLRQGNSVLPQPHSPYDAFVLSGPPGRELLLAIVTEKPLHFDWMPSDPASPARVLDRGDLDDLLKALQQAPHGSWTALSTYFDVVP